MEFDFEKNLIPNHTFLEIKNQIWINSKKISTSFIQNGNIINGEVFLEIGCGGMKKNSEVKWDLFNGNLITSWWSKRTLVTLNNFWVISSNYTFVIYNIYCMMLGKKKCINLIPSFLCEIGPKLIWIVL